MEVSLPAQALVYDTCAEAVCGYELLDVPARMPRVQYGCEGKDGQIRKSGLKARVSIDVMGLFIMEQIVRNFIA